MSTVGSSKSEVGASAGRVMAGAVLLSVAAASCGMLVVAHLAKFSLPGCGFGGGCDKAASSVWGKVPGIGWPVSFIGAAYFASMAVAWAATRGTLGTIAAWAARLGAAVSLLYLGIMAGEKVFCLYCAIAHACNLAFVVLCFGGGVPRVPRGMTPNLRGLAALAGCFVLISAVLGVVEQSTSAAAQKKANEDLANSTKQILNRSGAPGATGPAAATGPTGPAAATGPLAATGPSGATGSAGATGAAASTAPAQPKPATRPRVFTGRHRMGPEQAAIRVVMFFGYQCSDCKIIETQAQDLLKKYPQMSLSFKHFPLSSDCNPYMPQKMHPNACWAARAAESAAMLGGQAGFERMHNWLFSRSGAFTDAELNAALPGLGFDIARFNSLMLSPDTLAPVSADVEEAMLYGLRQTPMVFINGVELKGWQAKPDALVKTVDALALTNPPAAGPENDRPPSAGDKNVADWRDLPNMAWRSREPAYAIGPKEAPAQVQLWGDLQDANTFQADRMIRDYILGRDDVRYEYRYYPVDKACNANVPQTAFPRGCRAARAAEAAGQLGGGEGYWRMMDWLAANRQSFSDETLKAAAPGLGFDPAALLAALDSSKVTEAINGDIDIGRRLVIPEIPRLYVNGRVVNGWRIPGAFVFERVLEEAVTPKPPPTPRLPNINPPTGR